MSYPPAHFMDNQESFTMACGVRIIETRSAFNPQQYVTLAKWPPDEFGDVFGMAWPWGADMFRDEAFGEEFLRTERRRYEVHNRHALWVDYDAMWA